MRQLQPPFSIKTKHNNTAMIYISELSGHIDIPRHGNTSSTGFTVELSSNLTGDITIVEDGENVSASPLFYRLALGDLSSLETGEYKYTLYGDYAQVLETGLLTFGDYRRTPVVNNTFNKQKIQYNG